MRYFRRVVAALACVLLTTFGAQLAYASLASAATPLSVTLSASSDGASATWSGPTSIALKVGTTTSTTFAQMKVNSPPPAAPSVPPSFTTNNYNAGSPRWVVVFSNHAYLFGYPVQLPGTTEADFTGNQWQVNNPPLGAPTCKMYDTYAAALKCVDAAHADVSDAYIVADGDQLPGTISTLTNIQYNGQSPQQPIIPAPSIFGDEVNAFGNGFDVFRQSYAYNAVIAGWTATQSDPATNFVRIPHGSNWQFEATRGTGQATGLCVSDPDGGYAADPAGPNGLVLRVCNNGPFQQFTVESNGTLKNVESGLIVTPNGTGAQLRDTLTGASWSGGSNYRWVDHANLPG